MEYERFNEVAKFLKKNCKLDYPLSIRRVKLRREHEGECELKDGKFYIRVDRNLSEDHSIDVALHEVAHAMAWNKDEDMHGLSWGKAYSKIYRKFIDDFIGEV